MKLSDAVYKIYLAAIYIFIMGSPIIVFAISFNPTTSLSFPPEGFSPRWYEEFLKDRIFVDSFFRVSLSLAIITSIISVVLGLSSSFVMVRYDFHGKSLVESFLLSPMWMPAVLVGLGLLQFFVLLGIGGSFLALLIGHVLVATPYASRCIYASLHGFDRSLEEAALSLGADKIKALLLVTIPMIRPGLIAGMLFSFIRSFGEITMTLFITGPRTTTVQVAMFTYLQWESTPVIAAISTVQSLMVLGVALIIERAIGLREVLR